MISEELKKLYIKQFGLILSLILIIGEIILVNYLYPKREFSSEATERNFYEYMEKFSGKLTPEKEAAILEEQERIVDARNAAAKIEDHLYKGEYQSETEFAAEYEENRLITERKEAFDLVFKQYSSALEAPDDRYLTAGDYSGLGTDIPDVLMLALVIYLTAILFLNEESSGVITFVRISTNGKQKTLLGKLTAISAFIIPGQIFRTLLELLVMGARGDFHELGYPIRTLELFQSSPYDVSILQGFLLISALRLLGYFFIAALIILLSVTLRKALFTIFIPSAVCLLQQFAFDPATPAYYIPTGFLRGVGYLRGNQSTTTVTGDELNIFSEIPLAFLVILVLFTVIFIVISVIAVYNYYACKPFRFHKKALAATAAFSLCVMLCGCAQDPANIRYNLAESYFFVQNENDFFISSDDKITRISRSDYSKSSMLHDSLSVDRIFYSTEMFCCRDTLYCTDSIDIYAFSLSDYSSEKVFSLNYSGSPGFMGISVVKQPEVDMMDSQDYGFFVDDGSYYNIFSDRILRDGKCIIDEDLYRHYTLPMVCYDGRKIYYVNSLMQLKCYDTESGEITRLPGEFVRSIYYDGTRLLYSDKNGIFALNSADNSTAKISDNTAQQLTSDGEKIVYKSEGKLYLLDDTPVEIYDGEFEAFAILFGTHKLAVIQYSGDYELLDLPN